MVDATPACDQCGGHLNRRYPLRLVANDRLVATMVRHVCTACIGSSIVALEEAGRTCPGCAGLHQIFLRLAEGIRQAGDQTVTAIHVPPNKTPHVDNCEYSPDNLAPTSTSN